MTGRSGGLSFESATETSVAGRSIHTRTGSPHLHFELRAAWISGGYPGGGDGGGPVIIGSRTHSAGTSELARASGGDSMSVDDASALQDTLARLRQRYALHFYLPAGVQRRLASRHTRRNQATAGAPAALVGSGIPACSRLSAGAPIPPAAPSADLTTWRGAPKSPNSSHRPGTAVTLRFAIQLISLLK